MASSASLQFGVTSPEDLVNRAAEFGQPALALTDRDTVSGAVRFLRACQRAGVASILGVDLALAEPITHRPAPVRGGTLMKPERSRVTLLAHDAHSWAGLCSAISQAHHHPTRGEPQIERDTLMRLAAEYGLVVLLGPHSDVGRYLVDRRADRAWDCFRQWRDYGVEAHVELVTHAQPAHAMNLSDTLAARMLQWAVVHRVPAVLTNMVRYLDPHQAKVAHVLDAARQRLLLKPDKRSVTHGQGFLASSEHMQHTAQRISAMVGDPRDLARSLLLQTQSLAQRCVISATDDLGMNQVYVPELSQLLPGEQRTAHEILRERCDIGFAQYRDQKGNTAHFSQHLVRKRLDAELAVIQQMGFAGYILTVAEVVDMIRRMGIRVAVRGSGAGSFINYVVGISRVDPIEHDLLMERFVSTLRPGLPDIDIDVESDRRLEIYDAIFQRFGSDRTTCVSMHETYRVRHAIRDVGSALGLPVGEINVFAKSFPHIRARHVRSALAELPELKRSGLGKLAMRGELDEFLSLVESLDGLPRHVAMHPCGVILSNTTLLQRTPIQPSAQGYSMTQFDKDDVEHMGLLKLDVLGVRMQSALAYAIQEVARVDGPQAIGATESGLVDLESIPHDNPETFALIQSTRTLGCFQIESPGQRELIGKFGPETFNDLITDISLFRPGPVKSDMITPFLRARQGWAPAQYIHRDLESILGETHGVVVFHEQVMRIISIMTGCSLEQADLIRRQMGNRDELDGIRHWFYTHAQSRYSLDVVETTWDVLRAFASFGFCKAHAAAFALPTYQSAWFKAHHPAAFLAGVLTHDPGMYPKRLILDDARAFGITILGLDVNASQDTYVVERVGDSKKYGIRVSLSEVKGISAEEVSRIIESQPYQSLADFVQRSHISRPTMERIILAGGFDVIHGPLVSRRDLLFHLGELVHDLRAGNRLASVQQTVFSLDYAHWRPTPTGLPALTIAEKVKHEVEILGLDVSAHVMDFYQPMLNAIGTTTARQLRSMRSQSRILVAGVKVSTQTPPIRSGKRVAFITLDDSTGPIDATFFESVQDYYAPVLFHSWLLLVSGKVRRTGPQGVSIVADGCWELSQVYQQWQKYGLDGVNDLINQPEETDDPATLTRLWEHASGFQVSPYSDTRPAGADIARGIRQAAKMAP